MHSPFSRRCISAAARAKPERSERCSRTKEEENFIVRHTVNGHLATIARPSQLKNAPSGSARNSPYRFSACPRVRPFCAMSPWMVCSYLAGFLSFSIAAACLGPITYKDVAEALLVPAALLLAVGANAAAGSAAEKSATARTATTSDRTESIALVYGRER